ncbi:two-component system, chemotaxis family, sensor kinase CheA [Methylobacterium sp. ap11]|uniref:chemotaxis protein CheA n=1 Tax=Methylobacterium sp. ap11 TaxID=1761799 RepID=UPI0008C80C0C|nr:chemotaxis protein CheA [Methylobacterium sp. ap11]SEO87647.1 two-component system, chemotaxis family, sensor kinase CheA [Methylobacterium sp. ap11]
MTHIDPAEVFLTEASELLDRLESTLLDLGDRPQDRALIDTAFRALHTIKGSGAMFGFAQVATFTHDFETAFDLVRQGEVSVSRALIDVSLSAKDYIRLLIENPDGTDAVIGAAILDELQRLVRPGAGADAPQVPVPAEAPLPEAAADRPDWHLGLAFDPDILRNGTNPLALLDELRDLGARSVTARTDAVPDLAALDPARLHLGWDVVMPGSVTREAIEDVFLFVSDEMTLTLRPAAGFDPTAEPAAPLPEPAAPEAPVVQAQVRDVLARDALARDALAPEAAEPAPVAAPPAAARRTDDQAVTTVRVQAERLDALMDRVGELVIAQARLNQIAALRSDPAVKAVAEEIERLAAALRDTTMGIRMVPIGSLFGRFRRLVHDLSRDLGKPVAFVTEGEDTELDKTVIERLADPLVHLIRNAIDHGIEAPERRAAGGKAPTGRILLKAEHAGAQVLITVRDDGAGLDTARIRAKAEENGLLSPGTPLSDHEVHQFLFAPGFSTAREVSALSGRGVGMDVVKKTIESLRGSIDLATQQGAGSAFTLRLPLTLAIIEGLLIRVGDGHYVIPLSAVEECVELPEADREARGRSLLNIRGELVPYLRLRELFGCDVPSEPHQMVIITALAGERVGFVADQIVGSHQTVIKSLSKLHADVTMFSGATILGDGSAALILDVPQLLAAGQARAGIDLHGSNLTEAA